jgi:hypothetical protein
VAYLDAGYIAKFYVDEPDSPAVRRFAESSGDVQCAALGRVEVAATLHRKLREAAFGEGAFREVLAQFEDDCAAGLWTWLPPAGGGRETSMTSSVRPDDRAGGAGPARGGAADRGARRPPVRPVEYRSSGGRDERLAGLVGDLGRLDVAVIVTPGAGPRDPALGAAAGRPGDRVSAG